HSAVKAEKMTAVDSRVAQPAAPAPTFAQTTAEKKREAAPSIRKVGIAFASRMVRADTGMENSSPRELPSKDSADAAGQDMPIKSTTSPAAMYGRFCSKNSTRYGASVSASAR